MTRFLSTIFVTALLLIAPVEVQDQAPVRLRGGMLITPLEVIGAEDLPELEVEVQLNERGRVTAVEVLRVTPPSEVGAILERATREQIMTWRYAPRIQDGEAVPTTLKFTILYEPNSVAHSATAARGDPLRLLRAGSREEWARRLLAMPPEWRRSRLQELANTALRHLDTGKTHRAESGHFVLYTDVQIKGVADILVGNLEATLGTMVGLLEPDLPFYPERLKHVAVVYRDRASYFALASQVEMFENSTGMYQPVGLLAFYYDQGTPGRVLSILLHEVTHAFLDSYVVRPGIRLPVWLNEGFASYIGNSRIRRGHLQPGRMQSREIFMTPWGASVSRTESKQAGEELKRRIKRGEVPSVGQLLAAESEEFYGEDISTYYSMGWLMVHFLRHGEESWAKERFPRFLLYAAEGWPAEELIAEIYGLEGAQLQARFEEHVKRLY